MVLRRLRAVGKARVAATSVGVLLAACFLAMDTLAEKVYYRYQNAQGFMVQTDRLPPEVVSRGYQVVTANGDVLKVVPRELTEAERKARDARAEQQQRLAAERERIRKWDQSLILRYSDVKEIDAAKRRSLKEFDTRIGILQANLLSLKAQIESEQSDAANYLRRGKEVPKELAEHIDSLRSEVLYAENRVDELSRERIETEEQYELDKERFRLIMEQAALQ